MKGDRFFNDPDFIALALVVMVMGTILASLMIIYEKPKDTSLECIKSVVGWSRDSQEMTKRLEICTRFAKTSTITP